jgi:ATP phosphoribosyltransferase regulatory subunit
MQRSDYPLLPSGVKDHLPEAERRLRAVESALRAEFARCGYRAISTPMYEYLNVLERGLGRGLRQQTFKFVEPRSGEVVALRPDITPQVARIYATRYAEVQGPVRLCYEGAVVRFGGETESPEPREVLQVGVELLGCGGPEADAEVIGVLARALEGTGLTSFQLDVGQVEITRAVLGESGLESKARDQAVALIAKKDRSGLERLFGEVTASEGTRRSLLALTSLYGNAEVLDEAERVLESAAARAALADLREVVRLLTEDGYGDRITVDLGELRDFDYHDGTLFHAYVPGYGAPVAGGGRYDHLTERYGREAQATGFAVDVEELVAVLDRQGVSLGDVQPAVLIEGPRGAALELVRALQRAGCRASRALAPTDLESAGRLGLDFIVRVSGAEAEIRAVSGEGAWRTPVSEVPRVVQGLSKGE